MLLRPGGSQDVRGNDVAEKLDDRVGDPLRRGRVQFPARAEPPAGGNEPGLHPALPGPVALDPGLHRKILAGPDHLDDADAGGLLRDGRDQRREVLFARDPGALQQSLFHVLLSDSVLFPEALLCLPGGRSD